MIRLSHTIDGTYGSRRTPDGRGRVPEPPARAGGWQLRRGGEDRDVQHRTVLRLAARLWRSASVHPPPSRPMMLHSRSSHHGGIPSLVLARGMLALHCFHGSAGCRSTDDGHGSKFLRNQHTICNTRHLSGVMLNVQTQGQHACGEWQAFPGRFAPALPAAASFPAAALRVMLSHSCWHTRSGMHRSSDSYGGGRQ